MKIQVFKIICFFVISCGAFACDNSAGSQEVVVSGDIDESLFPIVIGGLDSNSGVYVKIPIELFGGSEEDLVGSEVDVYMNGSLMVSNIVVENLYSSSERMVRFYMSPVALGSDLGFLVTNSGGGETYFVGTVGSEESLATLSALTPSFNDFTFEVAEFFNEKLSAEGDATGTDINATYTVTTEALTYSEDCDADFMAATQFYTEGEIAEEFVTLTQNEGQLFWDDSAGVFYADHSFEFFEGSYVDEDNYTYTFRQGTIADDGSLSGNLFSTIVLDGTSLVNGYVGSCSVSTNFSGIVTQ